MARRRRQHQTDHAPGSIEELCRILPEGVGIIPLFLDIKKGERRELTDVIPQYEPQIAKTRGA